MSRVQLALNVGDLDASIAFYTKLFQTPLVIGPEVPWEIYTVLADAPVMTPERNGCCTPADEGEPVAIGAKPAAGCCW